MLEYNCSCPLCSCQSMVNHYTYIQSFLRFCAFFSQLSVKDSRYSFIIQKIKIKCIYIYINMFRTHLWKLFLFKTFCTHCQSCLLALHGHTNNSNALFWRCLYHENYNTSTGHMGIVNYNYGRLKRKTFGLSGHIYGVCYRGL